MWLAAGWLAAGGHVAIEPGGHRPSSRAAIERFAWSMKAGGSFLLGPDGHHGRVIHPIENDSH